MVEPDADELGEVAVARPDAEAALVDRLRVGVADADRHHLEVVLVGVEGTDRLAERLAHPVAAVRQHGHVGANLPAPRIEADRVHAARVDHPLRARPAGRLEHVVRPVDVDVADRLPGVLARDATHVHHRVDALDDPLDRLEVADVRLDELLVAAEIGRRPHVAQPEPVPAREVLPETGPDKTGRPRDQHVLHALVSPSGRPPQSMRPAIAMRLPRRRGPEGMVQAAGPTWARPGRRSPPNRGRGPGCGEERPDRRRGDPDDGGRARSIDVAGAPNILSIEDTDDPDRAPTMQRGGRASRRSRAPCGATGRTGACGTES